MPRKDRTAEAASAAKTKGNTGMEIISKIASFLLAAFVTLTSFPMKTVSERAADFRVTAYIVGSGLADASRIDSSHFADVTDVILISSAFFNTKGEITYAENFDTIVSNLKNAIGENPVNVYLNIIGPGATISTSDWNEQMDSQGKQHDIAFKSGKLEQSIKDALDAYGFDGIFFDYEYPLLKEHWKVFDEFIVSLDKFLGDDYKIGCAISSGLTKQSRKAIRCLDMVEAMAYDLWEDDGTHASEKAMRSVARQLILKGYKKEQIDIGIPFYARPTNHDAYWYGYNGWYDKLDEKGFAYDEGTGLTFSFNNYDTVYNKTQWAIERGLGGVMIWHYACDVPAGNELSLFNAVAAAKNDLMSDPVC